MITHKFPIGTKFQPRGKNYVCEVVDQFTTVNSKGEIISIRYAATHVFMGQAVTDCNVLETTIARGLIGS